MICKDRHSPVRCKDGWVSLIRVFLAKDGWPEKMTLLVSVPIESSTGTLKNFPYPKPGYEIRVQSESYKINFSQSEHKFIVLNI